jgi:signal transduction histidine kinase
VENEYTVVTVKDNGLGIKSDDLEKIFLAFKRMYTHVSGSEVGLYIVKRMVEGKEGKIEVNSIINKGSTFRIFIKNK